MRRWDPLPQGHRAWRKRRCGPLPWGHWQGGRVSDYPHAWHKNSFQSSAHRTWNLSRLLSCHLPAFTPSISEFIWRKGTRLMKLHHDGCLGGTSGTYSIRVPWLAWLFFGGHVGLLIAQRWSLRGLGRRQRSKAGVITSHQTRGPAMHPCPGTTCLEFPEDKGTPSSFPLPFWPPSTNCRG